MIYILMKSLQYWLLELIKLQSVKGDLCITLRAKAR